MNSTTVASSGLDTCPTIIIFSHSSVSVLSVFFKASCCTPNTRGLYSPYLKKVFDLILLYKKLVFIMIIVAYISYKTFKC